MEPERDATIIELFSGAVLADHLEAIEMGRLERSIVRVRELLDDPAALMRRACQLLDGTAKPLLVVAVLLAMTARVTVGAGQHSSHIPRRLNTITAARLA